jgi:hypothetical protein
MDTAMTTRRRVLLGALGIVVVSTLGFSIGDPGRTNMYTHLADAFLHGRLDISASLHDSVSVGPHRYCPFPPFPALLLAPLVAAFGIDGTRPVLVATLLTVVGVLAFLSILKKLEVSRDTSINLATAMFLGTAYWMCVIRSSEVWYFAHIVAVTAILLAIREALVGGRGAIVGALVAAAFLSRQMTILSSVFLCALLWERHDRPHRRAVEIGSLVACVSAAVVLYLLYNWTRFGDPFDTGYSRILLDGFQGERVRRYGLFHVAYLPHNLISYFFQGPHVEFGSPALLWPGNVRMDPFGTSITFASPFLFLGIWARWKRTLLLAAWTSVLLTLLPLLLYFNNGWIQPHTHRFALDFVPVLMVLVSLGTKRVPERISTVLIGYSVAIATFALFVVPALRMIASWAP